MRLASACTDSVCSRPFFTSTARTPAHPSGVIIGTTTDAFFSLDRLARFLLDAPLGLTIALNLDGGPLACQGISFNGYERKTYGRWEAQVEGEHAQLLAWPYGSYALPVVLAVFPR